jgi:hypothetical protein
LVEVVKKLSPQVDAAIAERKSSVTAMLPNAHPEAICKPPSATVKLIEGDGQTERQQNAVDE